MDYQKEFIRVFNEICVGRDARVVWYDFVLASACSMSNVFEKDKAKWDSRESEYLEIVKSSDMELLAKLLSITTLALEENPKQDFLGTLYQKLGLANGARCEHFTPYHLAELMTDITDLTKDLDKKDWVSVYDPCVGAGALLIAMANTYHSHSVNYQTSVFFVGQDINRVLALTTYIQLSLLGCPGYVIVGDALIKPLAGSVLNPVVDDCEIWYTPMYYREMWQCRRYFELLKANLPAV